MGCGATKTKVAPQEPQRLTAVVTDTDINSGKAQLCSVTGRSETAEIECRLASGLGAPTDPRNGTDGPMAGSRLFFWVTRIVGIHP